MSLYVLNFVLKLFLINKENTWWSSLLLILHSAINSEAGIVLSLFLIFGDFEPGCSYKDCSYKKKSVQRKKKVVFVILTTIEILVMIFDVYIFTLFTTEIDFLALILFYYDLVICSYLLMRDCWKTLPNERPTFSDIVLGLAKVIESHCTDPEVGNVFIVVLKRSEN